MHFVKTLRFQILLMVLLAYLVPTLVFSAGLGRVFFPGLREKAESDLSTGAMYAAAICRENVERVVSLAKEATYDNEINTVYGQYVAGEMIASDFLTRCRNYLDRRYGREEFIETAIFLPVNEPSLMTYSRTGYEAAVRFESTMKERVLIRGGTIDTRCLFVQNGDAVYLIRNLMNLRMERFGMLVLGIRMDALLESAQTFAGAREAEMTVKLGEAGERTLDWAHIPEGISRDEEQVLYHAAFSDWDWDLQILLEVSAEKVYREIYTFRRIMVVLWLALLPMLAVILFFVNRRIVRPVGRLREAAGRMEAGELGVTVPDAGEDELGVLSRTFSHMSVQLKTLVDRTYREEIALRDARIQAMQSRINPHFINNALETLNWEARMEGSERMSEMVEALSVLLNASMSRKNRRTVPLREEMEITEAYAYFVSLRFGERLRVREEIADDCLDCQVPQLCLQPIMENAVEHGIAPAGSGEILLEAFREGDKLILRVTNSGRGMDAEDEKRIADALSGTGDAGEHLGLANIFSRVRLLYADAAQCDVRGGKEQCTVVTLSLPAKNATEEELP